MPLAASYHSASISLAAVISHYLSLCLSFFSCHSASVLLAATVSLSLMGVCIRRLWLVCIVSAKQRCSISTLQNQPQSCFEPVCVQVVHVYRLVTRGTIEEKIVARAEQKLYLDQMVNSKRSQDDTAPVESADDMLSALKYGAQAIAGLDSADPPTEEELDAIIDRTRTTNDSVGRLVGNSEHRGEDFASTVSVNTTIRDFAGQIYGANKSEQIDEVTDISAAWTGSRKKKSRTETVHVTGAGAVDVLTSDLNLMRKEEQLHTIKSVKHNASLHQVMVVLIDIVAVSLGWSVQKAGRDFTHESTCLQCWDGGDLVTATKSRERIRESA